MSSACNTYLSFELNAGGVALAIAADFVIYELLFRSILEHIMYIHTILDLFIAPDNFNKTEKRLHYTLINLKH